MDVYDYLEMLYSKHLPHRTMLYRAARDIAPSISKGLTTIEGKIMREAWECSRTGQQNVACIAIADALRIKNRRTLNQKIASLISAPGFLSEDEKQQTSQLRAGTTLYRGCSAAEIIAARAGGCLGYSWTLDREVADFFADAHSGGAVLTAHYDDSIAAGVWLDTKESEVVWPGAKWKHVVSESQPSKSWMERGMCWDKRQVIKPEMNA
ncbi:hypothetical protein BAE30_16380 [Acidithiobacillus caldus]|uniref:Uncharacterized protein n=1 Tax=Acidithiobacillus caldus TaxID=33059 RepID=A0A1E7YRM0_9PROT|nr:hypothetical protein BAE30_16380 [Acidithiobacillus caldus]